MSHCLRFKPPTMSEPKFTIAYGFSFSKPACGIDARSIRIQRRRSGLFLMRADRKRTNCVSIPTETVSYAAGTPKFIAQR